MELPSALIKEIDDNETFFSNVDGKSLDEQQRVACVLNDCDLEIIAGAGTGKTQTLVAKSSYLIEKKNIKPSEILCLSFSSASVEDLSRRLNHKIETKTIHALGLAIVNNFDDKKVMDEYEFNKVFKEYLSGASDKQLDDLRDYCENNLANVATKIKLNELESEEEKLNFLISKTGIRKKTQSFIDLFKGKGNNLNDFKKLKGTCSNELSKKFTYDALKNMGFLNIVDPIYRFYEGYLSRNHLIDFNDMINEAIEIVEAGKMAFDYNYIFVDEYQDMSYGNFRLVKAIKKITDANLIVVGDDWQSIYGFRDSDLKLFTKFDNYFPGAKRVFIEKTYRNPQQLIDTAGKFIMKNTNQFRKALKSDTSIKKPIKIVYHSPQSEKENHNVYKLITNLSKNNKVLILGRHKKDINELLVNTKLVKKGRSQNYKTITDKKGKISNVEFRTVHAAKGLEADYVIIAGAVDEYVGFPNKIEPPYYMRMIHDWDTNDKFAEERRLFYVALTRAKKEVYIFTKLYNESKYVDELIRDSSDNLEIIHTDKPYSYSHLKEFR